jgi:hypothetical protein
MNNFGSTQFTADVTLAQDATLAAHAVRYGQLQVLLSGGAPLGHTHVLANLTDWENLGGYMANVLGDSPSFTWRLSGGMLSGAVRLEAGGGLEEAASGLRVNLTGIAADVVHTHLLADVTDLATELPGRVHVILSGTNTITWTTSGATSAASVRLKTLGGLIADADGLQVDFGLAANQVAAGNHTHDQLHGRMTIVSGSGTLNWQLNDQQLQAEVKLHPAGGLMVHLSGVAVQFGTGHDDVARGDHTHAELHVAATVSSSASLILGISGQQVSGAVRCDPDPAPDRGKLGIGVSGLYVELGTAVNQAAAGNHVHTPATSEEDGFLSAVDKRRLDALASGVVALESQVPFFREAPALVDDYLLGQYEWPTQVWLRSASATALCGTVDTTLELEVGGVLTGRQVVLPSGAVNTLVAVEEELFDVPVPAGTEVRWKIVGGGDIEYAHYRVALVTRLVAQGMEPPALDPDGGLVQTSAGLAVEVFLSGSNVRSQAGQLQIYDTGDLGWRPLTCVNGVLGVGALV